MLPNYTINTNSIKTTPKTLKYSIKKNRDVKNSKLKYRNITRYQLNPNQQ